MPRFLLILLLSTSTPAFAEEYSGRIETETPTRLPPQGEMRRSQHLRHLAELKSWEETYARPRTSERWEIIRTAPCHQMIRLEDQARCFGGLEVYLTELREVARERTHAVLAGFCSDEDAGGSHVLGTLEPSLASLVGMELDAQALASTVPDDEGKWRKPTEARIANLLKQKEVFANNLARMWIEVGTMHGFFEQFILFGGEQACVEVYGKRFKLERGRLLFTPTLGWPP